MIDAQNKITDLEANLSIILEAKSKLEQQLKDTQLQLQQVEKKLKEIQEERDAISDEVITLKVTILVINLSLADGLGRKQLPGKTIH